MRMFQVDAFTDRPFAGNPAAVLVLDGPAPVAAMQALAAENNLAETAFTWPEPGRPGVRRLRWFTPVDEAPFCGHATLATAHVLIAELGEAGPLAFETAVGPIRVAATPAGYELDLPRFDMTAAALPEALAGIFPEPPVFVGRNFENLFVVLAEAGLVRDFVPDQTVIGRIHPEGLVITAPAEPGSGIDFVSRFFCPGWGIPEDPVTGSIHATLAPWWAERLGLTVLQAVQASPRGGRLVCTVAPMRVRVAGPAVTVFDARLHPGIAARFRSSAPAG